MGGDCPRVEPRLDDVLRPVGAEYRLFTFSLYYQTVSFSQHPRYSLVCILAVVLFNIVIFGLLRRARSRVDDLAAGDAQNAVHLLPESGGRLPLRAMMASLIEVRDMLALQGRMEANSSASA